MLDGISTNTLRLLDGATFLDIPWSKGSELFDHEQMRKPEQA